MAIHWHRRDLRLADNRALAAAAGGESVVSVFVFDPEVLAHAAPPRVAFLLDALEGVRERYRDLGSDLLVREGDPGEVLAELADVYDTGVVHWNQDYSGLGRERAGRVREKLDGAGVDAVAHHDALLHDPGTITTNEGKHYSVFSYFWRKWRDREKDAPIDSPAEGELASVEGGSIPDLSDLGFDEPEADLPKAGPGAARERLERWCDGPIYEYDRLRDHPAADATSRLSADLKYGQLGIRAVWAATEGAADRAPDEEAAESVESYQRQLAWREFYAHVLAARPDVVTENYREYDGEIEWRFDPAELRAWKDGETGYPIVDAGMRQLRVEGWMHNRVRMIVASFLTKDLLIDWRAGYDWFREKLVDHDPANDSGGWQWAASTGTDAQPYFRVFNPTTQCERHDPDGEYVRRYVPELRGVETKAIHDWPDLDDEERAEIAPGYVDPIVDHAQRREEAIEMFERAREG